VRFHITISHIIIYINQTYHRAWERLLVKK